jgi:hypothetical protein
MAPGAENTKRSSLTVPPSLLPQALWMSVGTGWPDRGPPAETLWDSETDDNSESNKSDDAGSRRSWV